MFVILQYLHYRDSNTWYLVVGCFFGLAFFCIVSCIAYANTHAGKILEVLTKSVPELADVSLSSNSNKNSEEIHVENKVHDYELIGGRGTRLPT